jgi:hypothetical protein
VVAAEADSLIKLDAQPTEGFNDIFLSSRHETGRVGILNSEDEVAAVLTSKEIVVQSSAHAANM